MEHLTKETFQEKVFNYEKNKEWKFEGDLPCIIDFYADWCITCVELDHVTFADAEVKQALANFVRVKVDVTANDEDAKALSKSYSVIGPPALIFYNQSGVMQPHLMLVGFTVEVIKVVLKTLMFLSSQMIISLVLLAVK